jgi:hypothetical protein
MMPEVSAERLFRTPPDVLHLFKPDLRPDTKRIASFLSYKKEDISAAANIPLSSVRFDERIPEALLERAKEWATAINLVGNFFQDERKTMFWFQTPNPLLGNITPKEMIRRGRFRKLLEFIQTALDENPPPNSGKEKQAAR